MHVKPEITSLEMISLLWLGIFMNVFWISIPKIGLWITKTFFVTNGGEIYRIQQELKAHRREQDAISIVDEFAKHARVSRKISVLQTKLEEEIKLHAASHNKINLTISRTFNLSLYLICTIIFLTSSEPVVRIPRKWLLPFSYFGEPIWSIGFVSWLTHSFICIKNIHSSIYAS